MLQQPILVPLDGSDLAQQALPYAQALADPQCMGEPDCQLILLEVSEEDGDLSALERHASTGARLEMATGDPAEQILRVARDLGAGLIVMTTHGRGALGRWAFGSVADAVTRTSPIPVLVVRPGDGDPGDAAPVIQRLVVPLDGSRRAEDALPTARSLAMRLNVPVHLVMAVDLAEQLPVEVMPTVAFHEEVYQETVSALEADAEATLTEAAERLRGEGVTTTLDVLHGSPLLVLSDAVRPGDLIVMASHGLRGAGRWLRGSVAEKLIREGPVPVVLVPTAASHGAARAASGAVRTGSSSSS